MIARGAIPAKVGDIVESLELVCDIPTTVLPWAFGELCAALGAEKLGAYRLRRTSSGLEVDWYHGVGDMDWASFSAALTAVLRLAGPTRVLRYDPMRPEPGLRNRVASMPPGTLKAGYRAIARKFGFEASHQLASVLAERGVMVAWFGAARPEPWRPREYRALGAVAQSLRRRLILERHIGEGRLTWALLGTTIDAIPQPAFVLRGRTPVLANVSGRVLIARDRKRVLADLSDHLSGRASGGFDLTRVSGAGVATHMLAVQRPRSPGAGRLEHVATLWGLTPRQRHVLEHVVSGMSNKAIAAELGVSETTVEFHVGALLDKVGCESRSELSARYWTAT